MKKSIFLFLVFLIFTQLGFAQKFRAGVIGGLVASDLVGIDPYNSHFKKAGVTLGGMVNATLGKKNSFQFEILYTQKGSLQRDTTPGAAVPYYKLNLNYLEIPLIYGVPNLSSSQRMVSTQFIHHSTYALTRLHLLHH